MKTKIFLVLLVVCLAQISLVKSRWYPPCSQAPRIEPSREVRQRILQEINYFVEASVLKNVTKIWTNKDYFTKCFVEEVKIFRTVVKVFKSFALKPLKPFSDDHRFYHKTLVEETKKFMKEVSVYQEKFLEEFTENTRKQYFIAAWQTIDKYEYLIEFRLVDAIINYLSLYSASYQSEKGKLYKTDEILTERIREFERGYFLFMKNLQECMEKTKNDV